MRTLWSLIHGDGRYYILRARPDPKHELAAFWKSWPILFTKMQNSFFSLPCNLLKLWTGSVLTLVSLPFFSPTSFVTYRWDLVGWQGKEMVWGSKTFMPFGGGVRQCVGAEFARLQITIFLHHLVTYYDFSLVQDCEVTRTPFPQFTKGLLINISHSTKGNTAVSKS